MFVSFFRCNAAKSHVWRNITDVPRNHLCSHNVRWTTHFYQRVSSTRGAIDQRPKRHNRSSRNTVHATLWPSHDPHKCTRQAPNGSSAWRQPEEMWTCTNFYLTILVFWTSVVWSNIRQKTCIEHRTGQDKQKLRTMCTKRAKRKCALTFSARQTPHQSHGHPKNVS